MYTVYCTTLIVKEGTLRTHMAIGFEENTETYLKDKHIFSKNSEIIIIISIGHHYHYHYHYHHYHFYRSEWETCKKLGLFGDFLVRGIGIEDIQ